MLAWLLSLELFSVSIFFFLLNLAILGGALFVGRLIDRLYRRTRQAVSAAEWLLALSTVTVNAAISVAGWALWKSHLLQLNLDAGILIIVRDTLILLVAMDFALYVLHRLAHVRLFYGIAHFKHHEYRDVRTLTLFAMHPFEAAGFGVLWVTTLVIYPFAVEAVVMFLQLNLYFGVTAHCGFPLYSQAVSRLVTRSGLTDPDFHLRHHRDEACNLGFYTTIWDRLFATYQPRR
ncbi:MAG: sterol desaturase family protein [Turneriella sp.]